MSIQALIIRRQAKVLVPAGGSDGVSAEVVASFSATLEPLGYCLSPQLFTALRGLSLGQISAFQLELIEVLKGILGTHVQYRPMYRNFPNEVMEKGEAELYWNAVMHYATEGNYMPPTWERTRGNFSEFAKVRMLGLGSAEDLSLLASQLLTANTAWSLQNVEDLDCLIRHIGPTIWEDIPEQIPQKENIAHLTALALRQGGPFDSLLVTHCKTATDILRVGVALSGGDVSLGASTKFVSISRSCRKQFLAAIERSSNPLDDMVRRRETWKRFGERLHPGEYRRSFPRAASAFDAIRKQTPGATYRGQVENALRAGSVAEATRLLTQRPGELVRRLDHLLRLQPMENNCVLEALHDSAPNVSTPVLLQVLNHFRTRGTPASHRVFIPKGQVSMAHVIPNVLPGLPESTASGVVDLIQQTLLKRFSQLSPLGNVFIDEDLRAFNIPFALRSASKALRTVARGSKIALPVGNTLRVFIWWKNGNDRTDLDLSAVMLDDQLLFVDYLSYYNLRGASGCHSGDIVDAPSGACEFIDVNPNLVRKNNARYVAMIVTSYTQQPYCELPECFAGYMARSAPASGEIFEPRTVQARFDLAADAKIALPILFDLQECVAIWCDLAAKFKPTWNNNIHAQKRGIVAALTGITEIRKMSVYDLLWLHAMSRGTLVASREEADTVFSVDAGLPYELERIAAEFMA